MEFYLLYIALIAFLLVLDYALARKSRFFEYIALIIIILVSGLRDNVGYDFGNYYYNYLQGYLDPGLEPGYLLFINILRYVGASPYVMFFLMALAIYIFFYIGIRKFTSHSGIALLLFMLIPGLYLNSLSIIRQELAIGIAFTAFYYLHQKRYTKYALLMFVAFTFHFTALFVVFIHLFAIKYSQKIKPKLYIILIILSIVFSVFHLQTYIVKYTYAKYTDLITGADEVSFIKTLVLNGMTLGMLMFYNKVCKTDLHRYMFFFVVLATIMVNIFSSFLVFTRISYYFRVFEIVLIAELIFVFARKYRPLLTFAVFSIYLTIFISSLQNDIAADGHGQPKIIPYKTIVK